MDENQVEQFQSPAPEQIATEPPAQQIPEPVYQQAPAYQESPVYQQPPVQQPYYPQQPVYPQPPVQQPYYPQQPVYQQPPVQQPYYPQQPVYPQAPVQQPYYPQQPMYQHPYQQPYPQFEQEPNWQECETSSFKKALTSVITCLFPVGSIIGIVMGAKARGIASRAISYAKRHNRTVSGKTKAAAIMAKAGMITGIVFTAIYSFILMILTNSY